MKKRVFAIVLIFVFVLTSTVGIYAKGRSFGGGSRSSKSFSSSYKGSSKSSGFFGSSKSKSSSSSSKSSGLFKSKSSSSNSSGSVSSNSSNSASSKSSNSRSIPGSSKSYSGSSSSSGTSTKSFSSKSASKKYSYMQDTYKKQVSGKNFNTYKQKLNADQQKVFDSSMNRSYGTSSRRMNFEDAMNTRTSRINSFGKRPVYININTGMFGSPFSYGYAYVGPWDLWFLMRASDMFWFHHWNEISPYRSYFDQQQYQQLEQRVQALESQGIQRDPEYLDPDVDPDLQLSQQYQEQNVDKVYYTDKNSTNSASTGVVVVIVIVTAVALVIVIRKLSKPKPQNPHYSRIY